MYFASTYNQIVKELLHSSEYKKRFSFLLSKNVFCRLNFFLFLTFRFSLYVVEFRCALPNLPFFITLFLSSLPSRLYPIPTTPYFGASRDRTDDPLLAKQVLSQLSYGPVFFPSRLSFVGLSRLEPPTPRLSSVCSNQLSYRPPYKTRGLLSFL